MISRDNSRELAYVQINQGAILTATLGTPDDITAFVNINAGGLGGVSASGTISGSSKTFRIDHPLYPDKKLIHACIEGPTLDVFYRGQSQLINGEIESKK